MENFKIELPDQTLNVNPQEDGNYAIFENGEEIGILTPILNDKGVHWQSERIDEDYAKQIGELIEEHEM